MHLPITNTTKPSSHQYSLFGQLHYIGVNPPAFGGTVPHFHQMSCVPRNETDVPHFVFRKLHYFFRCCQHQESACHAKLEKSTHGLREAFAEPLLFPRRVGWSNITDPLQVCWYSLGYTNANFLSRVLP